MSATAASAERTVSTSALIVLLVYVYRRATEPQGMTANHIAQKGAAKQLAGAGPVAPLSHFVVGFGAAFLAISVVAQLDPQLGSALAILVATSAFLANGTQLFQGLDSRLGGNPQTSSTPSTNPTHA